MKRSEFSKLKTMNDNFSNNFIGQKFLYGDMMVKQLEDKKIGDMITYYEVTEFTDIGSVIYAPITEILEKE